MTMVGYARVSTHEQEAGLAAQIAELRKLGCTRIFQEQVSSVACRPEMKTCLGWLRDGDVLCVTKPDRLARSTRELLDIEADLTKRDIGLVVLSMGGEKLDTRNPTSKLMLTILGGVATWEREIMLDRQRDGIAKAKADGKYKGRKATVRAQSEEIIALYDPDRNMGPLPIARQLGVSRSSVYRILKTAGVLVPADMPAVLVKARSVQGAVAPDKARSKPKARGKAR